uniref:endogenous retrovirus group K member 6 Pro protein-like n=1 Tax=Agelaius phoeniceus TaxID=39638 RepID=UPI0023EDC67B|nr:endogenous retrovirus group K member 6 Pro protein-like [Agelaius phoeniceus]
MTTDPPQRRYPSVEQRSPPGFSVIACSGSRSFCEGTFHFRKSYPQEGQFDTQNLHLNERKFRGELMSADPFHRSWTPGTGTPIAQAFLLPKDHREQIPLNPTAMWAQVVGPSKPTIECGLTCKGKKTHLPGMLDTGADVTIIARSEWPAHWDLQPVAGMISGIGGATVSMRSKNNILVEGPEGKLATIRPFVVRAPITLWGRDVLSQWGASLCIPTQDF